MTFSYTDKQLNRFNREQYVYSIDSHIATSKKNKIIVDKTDDKLGEGEINIVTIDNQRFRVVSTLNDKKTGAQAMAVAPIVEGEPDYSSVAVVVAGTTPTDLNDIRGAISSINPEASSPQLEATDKWLQKVKKQYRVTQLTGYSQGAFVLKLGAKYHIATTVFNGWFSYDTLSRKEADFIKKNTHLFKNFRRTNDDVVSIKDGNLKGYKGVNDFGTIYWVKGKSHKIFDWKFNSKGELIDEDGNVVVDAHQSRYLNVSKHSLDMLDKELDSIKQLRNRLKADGLSKSEQIYLDSEQATAVIDSLETIATSGLDAIIAIYDKAIAEAEKLWENALYSAYNLAPRLYEGEIYDTLSVYGVTQQSIVEEVYRHCQEKKALANRLKDDFQRLARNIHKGIQKQLDTDKELAGRFEQWNSMKNFTN